MLRTESGIKPSLARSSAVLTSPIRSNAIPGRILGMKITTSFLTGSLPSSLPCHVAIKVPIESEEFPKPNNDEPLEMQTDTDLSPFCSVLGPTISERFEQRRQKGAS